eukprot:TRINITY_DN12691_c0_g1_i2.p1 TRINITY_DN12691_c0_g1~~TRINITY_DN12691_c0_g1_i2.p1  ORF type:complete len:205 (+),score=52.66 TRINITY_DN12691_c0_g1_i2:134-748(+)
MGMDKADTMDKSQDVPKSEEANEDYSETTPSADDMFVCNGMDHSIFVEISPTRLVRKFDSPIKKILKWFDFTITDYEGQKDHNEGSVCTLKLRTQEVKPHSVHKIHMGRDNDDKWMMLEVSAQSHIFYKDENTSEMVEIGGGFILGSGQGIIVTQRANGDRVVEQSMTDKWWRKSDPWVERTYNRSKNPHNKLEKGRNCSVCSG